jgi:hypothetical protein
LKYFLKQIFIICDIIAIIYLGISLDSFNMTI